MPFEEHVYSVLIVSASNSFNDNIVKLLPGATYSPITFAKSVNEAQRNVTERVYDIIIINAPLPDDYGLKLAIDVSSNKTSVVLLFVRNDMYTSIYEKVRDYGVFTLHKPVPAQAISQALDWLKATRERLRNMQTKNLSLQEKMEEIKLINRAKWARINSLGMTEADAHRYIEKQAMDRCVTRREIAENIIQTYK